MRISFLHTADVHVSTFDRIFADLGSDARLVHRVEADLLARARFHGLESVRADTMEALADLAFADAVVCTCSTLGPLADSFAENFGHVFRIDRPVMEEACRIGGRVLVAICLESTRAPTLALLDQCAVQLDKKISVEVHLCDVAWPFFEAGDIDGFADSISRSTKKRLGQLGSVDCIVLAQASMRVAAEKLEDVGVPILTSPLMAAKRSIEIAHQSTHHGKR
jgi:Asp/Glu/Hydantoin racemase